MQISDIRSIDDNGTILKADKVEIPDGKWTILLQDSWVGNDPVSTFSSYLEHGTLSFVGLKHTAAGIIGNEVAVYCAKCAFTREHHSDFMHKAGDYLLVADCPFGLVLVDYADGDSYCRIIAASQVRDGKLSELPMIYQPDFSGTSDSSDPLDPKSVSRFFEQRMRLGDLASIIGMTPSEALQRYLGFLTDDDLFLVECQINSQDDILTAWVPAYWATAVIYLSFFGQRPQDGDAEYTWQVRDRRR